MSEGFAAAQANRQASGLAAALMTNALMSTVLLLAFSFLRTRMRWLYSPRERMSSDYPRSPDGFLAWAWETLRVPDSTVFHTAGCDAMMYVRFFRMCARFFLGCMAIGAVIAIVNLNGGNGKQGLEALTMANVQPNSSSLWMHVVAAYAITGYALLLLYWHQKDYMRWRHMHLKLPDNQHSRTIMVQNIPDYCRTDQGLTEVYQRAYPNDFGSATMAKDIGDLHAALAERHSVWETLKKAAFRLEQTGRRDTHMRFCQHDSCMERVDTIQWCEARLRELNARVERLQKQPQAPVQTGFVTFLSFTAAYTAVNVPLSEVPFAFETSMAPEPRDLFPANLDFTHFQRAAKRLSVTVCVVFIFLFYTVPVSAVASLTSVEQLSAYIPWFKRFASLSPALRSWLEGFLPTVAFSGFVFILPYILRVFGWMRGEVSRSRVALFVLNRFFVFCVFHFFLVPTLASSLLDIVTMAIDHPADIVRQLGESIPQYAFFFSGYIVLQATTIWMVHLVNLGKMAQGLFLRLLAVTPEQKQRALRPWCVYYEMVYPTHILIFVIGVSYSTSAPMVLAFAALYFAVGYVCAKYQALFVMTKIYEGGGIFWPVIFGKMLLGIICFQFTLIGLMGLKGLPGAASALLPLPAGTLYFYRWVHDSLVRRMFTLPRDAAQEQTKLLWDQQQQVRNQAFEDIKMYEARDLLAPALRPEQALAEAVDRSKQF